jgi:class 3 adenylate cyclase
MNRNRTSSTSSRLPQKLAAVTAVCTLLPALVWVLFCSPQNVPTGPVLWLPAVSILLAPTLAAALSYRLSKGLPDAEPRIAAAPASSAPSLGGEEKDATILFCDIRRFTALAEEMPATAVVELLNTFFSRMIQVVLAHEGTVDKLMGDSVMALFGVPQPSEEAPLRAVRCALGMHQALAELNRERARLKQPPIQMGIGINSGPVVAGNIGSIHRMDYTVIGDHVNIAARLQGIAEAGEILVTEATYAKVRDLVQASPRAPARFKGRQHPVAVYRIESLNSPPGPSGTPPT